MAGFIVSATIGGLMIILSIVMLMGHGSSLIAGYNTKSKSEKEKYDAPALSKFMGKILLPLAILVILMGIERLHELSWFIVAWVIAFVGILVIAIIYANTGNRFKK